MPLAHFYLPWYGSLLDPQVWLTFGCLGSMIYFVVGLWRAFPLHAPYLSPLFVASFGPVLCCSMLATVRTHAHAWRLVDNADKMLAQIRALKQFGWVLTLAFVLVYSGAHLLSRRFLAAPSSPSTA